MTTKTSASTRILKRTQEQRRRVTQRKLIDAVICLICRSGYARLRSREIATAAGTSWGAAQHLFGSKDGLLLQVATRVSDELVQRLDASVEQPAAELRDRLARVVTLIWELYTSADYLAMVEIVRGARADGRFHQALLRTLAPLAARIEQLWLAIFNDARVSDARNLACCNIVVLTLSGLAARKIYLNLAPYPQVILDELIDSVAASLGAARGDAQRR